MNCICRIIEKDTTLEIGDYEKFIQFSKSFGEALLLFYLKLEKLNTEDIGNVENYRFKIKIKLSSEELNAIRTFHENALLSEYKFYHIKKVVMMTKELIFSLIIIPQAQTYAIAPFERKVSDVFIRNFVEVLNRNSKDEFFNLRENILNYLIHRLNGQYKNDLSKKFTYDQFNVKHHTYISLITNILFIDTVQFQKAFLKIALVKHELSPFIDSFLRFLAMFCVFGYFIFYFNIFEKMQFAQSSILIEAVVKVLQLFQNLCEENNAFFQNYFFNMKINYMSVVGDKPGDVREVYFLDLIFIIINIIQHKIGENERYFASNFENVKNNCYSLILEMMQGNDTQNLLYFNPNRQDKDDKTENKNKSDIPVKSENQDNKEIKNNSENPENKEKQNNSDIPVKSENQDNKEVKNNSEIPENKEKQLSSVKPENQDNSEKKTQPQIQEKPINYFLEHLIQCQESLFDYTKNRKPYVLSMGINVFRILNELIMSDIDSLEIIIEIENIFPVKSVFSLVIYYQKLLLLEGLEGKNENDLTQSEIDEYELTEHKFDRYNQMFLTDDCYRKKPSFSLSINLYLYCKLLGEKYDNLGSQKIFGMVTEVKTKKSNKNHIRKTIQKVRQEYKFYFIRKPGDYKTDCLVNAQTENLLKFYLHLVKSIEVNVVQKSKVVDEDKPQAEIKNIKKIYFVNMPRLQKVNRKSVSDTIMSSQHHGFNERLLSLINFLPSFLAEIEYKENMEREKKNLALNLMKIDYTSINYFNLAFTTVLIILLLIFMDDSNINNESPLFYLIQYCEILQIIGNLTFIFIFLFSKYPLLTTLKMKFNINYSENEYIRYIRIYLFECFILCDDISFLIMNVLLCLLNLYNQSLFGLLSLQLFTIIKFIPTIKEIFLAFYLKFANLIGMIIFLAILIFSYANFSILFLRKYFVMETENGVLHNVCNNIVECFIIHFNDGVREEGGMGSMMPLVSTKNKLDYGIRFAADLIFYISVILLILNMINGLIITTFSQIREERESLEEELLDKCLICFISKSEFEKRKVDFNFHVKFDHNIHNYAKYFLYLTMVDEKEMDANELYLNNCLKEKDIKFFPIGKSLCFGDTKIESI